MSIIIESNKHDRYTIYNRVKPATTLKAISTAAICATKSSTKKEIVKRVMAGKEFMDIYYLRNPEIRQVAIESSMSEFHFYRCFKQVIGITPYQYMLEKRLTYASVLLGEKTLLVSEIATQCGFPDVFTFSKAFKRKYGVSPTKVGEKGC